MTIEQLERRVNDLERQVAELRRELKPLRPLGSVAETFGMFADDLGLLITGGSDYHGDPAHGVAIGASTLPDDAWQRLHAARHRHAVA